MFPLIISAPHACSTLPPSFLQRISLSEFEIWQMSDPFTDETSFHPNAFAIHRAPAHRILGDINRDRSDEFLFRTTDFYGRTIWKEGEGLLAEEKEDLLRLYWDPFRKSFFKSFQELANTGASFILHIDHHNTATDHPAHRGEYLPPIVLGNYGDHKGEEKGLPLSAAPEIMKIFQDALQKTLPLTVELNKTYQGSALVRLVRDEIAPHFPMIRIASMVLEYDLGLLFNPLSKKPDPVAQRILHNAINTSIDTLFKNIP